MVVPHSKISRNVLIVLAVFCLIGGGLLFVDFARKKGKQVFVTPLPAPATEVRANDVYALAEDAATTWSPDAVVSYVNSGSVEQSAGHSATWKFIFISEAHKGVGYHITITENQIVSKEEINYQGAGAPLPSGMISQDEAVRRVRQMPGYERVEILGVEAVYGPSGKVWYWGVKTSKGSVSVEAK